MAITIYSPREEYIGNGLLSDYTFDFKITSLSHLLILSFTAAGVPNFRATGEDTIFISSVDYDPVDGGGTVHLVDPLADTDYLVILLANDQPLQESEFKDKRDFTLKRFEAALDVQSGAIQRLAYLVKRCLKIPETILDSVGFDGEMPVLTADYLLAVNPTGDGFSLGPSVPSLTGDVADAAASAADAAASAITAATNATAAGVSETNAAASDASAAASAAAAAASAASAASMVGFSYVTVAVAGAYSPSTTTALFILFDASSGNQSLVLPAITGSDDGLTFSLKKTDNTANTVTITGTVEGEVDPVITDQYTGRTVVAISSVWFWKY